MNIFKWYPSTSFRRRLTFRVFLIVTLVFAGVGYVINLFIMGGIMAEAEMGAEQVLDNTNQKINNILNSVEVAVENNLPTVENCLNDPEKMYGVANRIVRVNPVISGSSIALIPGYLGKRDSLFAAYAYQDSTGIHRKSLAVESYDYTKHEWFTVPVQEKCDSWSEPYYDDGGGDMVMVTYSHPIFDKDSNVVAVVTADLSLDNLSMLIANIEYYDKAYSFAISQDGTYLVHPDTTLILKKTIFDDIEDVEDTALYLATAKEMTEGKRGMNEIDMDGEDHYIFYAPVKRMDWSIGIACPEWSFLSMAVGSSIIVVTFLILGLLFILLLCSRQVKQMLLPLERFADSVDEIARGNLKASLPEVKTKDEMFKLRNSFVLMQESLDDYISKLKVATEERGRIQGELRVAKGIQEAMIPKVYPPYPDRDDVDIYGQLFPAREVGGDLFDFFIRDEKLFFCIGDVSGKGVPASLVMAVTRSLFRTIAAHENQPRRIMSRINEFMAESNETMMFVTLFMGVLDLPKGLLRYCNAGHCAPLLLRKDVTRMNVIPNIPVGIQQGYNFEADEIGIPYNTTIFLYTDGVTEAENNEHELFGETRMLDIAQTYVDKGIKDPAQLIGMMTDAVNTFTENAEQSDDLTMLSVRYCKVKEPNIYTRKLVFNNDIANITQLKELVDDVCEKAHFDDATTMSMNLAMEEAVVNVISYAYPMGEEGEIVVEAKINSKRLKFVITDKGMPFDITKREEADVTLPADERPIGGLGIFLVRHIMDSVNYERVGDKNILSLRKLL